MFYSSQDPKSTNMVPIFLEAAYNAKQQGLDVVFTKFELVTDEQVVKWSIDKIPKIVFYSKGEKYHYTEAKSVKGFFNFLNTELNTNFTYYELNERTIMNNTNLLNQSKSIILFIGNPHILDREFDKFRRLTDEYSKKIDYYWSNNTSFLDEFNISANSFGLVAFKYLESSDSFEQGKLLDISDVKSLKMKLRFYSKSTLDEFDVKILERILDKAVPSSILIYGDGDEEANETIVDRYLDEFDPVSEKYQDILWSYKCDFNNKALNEFFQMFRIKKEELPTIVILNSPTPNKTEDLISKYKYDNSLGPLNNESYANFIENWKADKLGKYQSSEATPEKPFNDHGVYHVVWNNFKDFLKTESNIYLVVCSDSVDDKECVEVKRRINAICDRFRASTNLTFAFFEPLKNENQLLDLEYIPDIIFFPNEENKLSKQKLFEGNFTTNEIIEFVKGTATNARMIENTITAEEETLINNEKPFSKRKLIEDDEESNDDDDKADEDDKLDDEDDDKEEDDLKEDLNPKSKEKSKPVQKDKEIKEDNKIDL